MVICLESLQGGDAGNSKVSQCKMFGSASIRCQERRRRSLLLLFPFLGLCYSLSLIPVFHHPSSPQKGQFVALVVLSRARKIFCKPEDASSLLLPKRDNEFLVFHLPSLA